jgi:PAS domain S-box-containing protein
MTEAVAVRPSGQVAGFIWTTDRELCFTTIEGAALRVTEGEGEKLVGASLYAFFQTSDPTFPPIAAHLRALSGESAGYETFAWGRWWDCQVEPLHDGAGVVIGTVGVALDATGRRQAAEALRESRQQYEDLVNSIDGIVWEAECESARFTFVSQQAERLLGYPTSRWLTDPTFWVDHMHPDDRGWAPGYCASATAEMRPHEFEYRMIAADGRIVWLRDIVTVVVEANRPVKLRGVMVDVTEKKQAEEDLRAQEEQYRSIFEATSDGVMITDLDSERVVAANPASDRMHGYPDGGMIGLHPSQFIHPDDLRLYWAYKEAILAGDEFRCRARDIRRDGSSFHIEVYGRAFVYRGKRHALGVLRDVSEQVDAQQLLEARVAERTRELTTLLEVSQNMTSTLELEPLLDVALEQLKGLVDYTGARIFTVQGPDLVVACERLPVPGNLEHRTRWPIDMLGEPWDLAREGHTITIPDVRGETAMARHFQRLAGDEIDSFMKFIGCCMWIPLLVRQRIIGVMSVTHRDPHFFTPRHVELATAVARQAAIAIENAQLYEAARGRAALEERQHLARELHDSVSQALYGIALGARTARTLLDRDVTKVAQPLDYVLSLAEAGLAEMRALIFELRPESLELEGLVAALDKHAASLRARHGLTVTTDLGDEPELPLDAKEALYRIAQEAIHNTVKHAQAINVRLRLSATADEAVLEVADDGVGFDVNGSFPGHLGLRSMRERIEAQRGKIDMDSAPGAGTRIRVTLPR